VRLSAVMKEEGSLVEKDVTWEIGTADASSPSWQHLMMAKRSL
jgi:hypothetical protein